MENTLGQHRSFIILFMIMILTSSIVFFEPAPYDLLFVLVFGIAIITSYLTYTSVHFWPTVLLLLFLETNLISLLFIREVSVAAFYLVITIYCIVTWVGLVGIASYFGKDILDLTFKMYVIAALLITIPSLVAYFSESGALDLFIWGEARIKGLFKDPNVFGPFLVPPALYALWRIGKAEGSKKTLLMWIIVFLLMATGVLLSYSRAAWGQFILAIGLYFLLINDQSTKRLKTLFILLVILVPTLIYLVMATEVGDLFFDRIGIQGYDEDRFGQQKTSLEYMVSHPLGFGPGQSEIFLSQSTHNLFIRLISENGILGLIFFSLFYLATLMRSVYMTKITNKQYKGFFIILTVSLIGILFNSLFVDTLHWRHLWLLLALPWIDYQPKK